MPPQTKEQWVLAEETGTVTNDTTNRLSFNSTAHQWSMREEAWLKNVLFIVADHLQSLWGQTPTSSGGSSNFTTPSPPDQGSGSNLHSLFSSSPLLAATNPAAAAAAAVAAAHLSLPPPPPPGPQPSGSRLPSPGNAEAELYGGQGGSYPPFGSFHQVNKTLQTKSWTFVYLFVDFYCS